MLCISTDVLHYNSAIWLICTKFGMSVTPLHATPTSSSSFLILILLLAVQPLVNLSLFQNCPPLLLVLLLTSPVPHTFVFSISLNWFKPPQLRFHYTSSAVWFKNSYLSAMIQFLHFTEVSQPSHYSYFYHLDYVWFIAEQIKLIMVACSLCTIIINRTINLS
jgi:hypothetical protein